MLQNCAITGFADEIDQRLSKQIDVLKKLGISYVEYRSGDGKGIADYSCDEAKEAAKKLNGAGIKVSALGSPIGKVGVNDDFAKHFEVFKHVVELAGIFGTKYIRVFSFYIPKDENPDSYKNKVIDQLCKLVAYAQANNVVLLHENEKAIFGDNAKRCLALFESLYGEHFRCTFDFANFIQCGQNTFEAYQMLKKYIAYIHVKDAIGEDVVPAGKGEGQVKKILTLLDASGYDGFLSLEPHLFNFAGLEKLSVEKQENGRLLENAPKGEAAFTLAYDSLMQLLK
jgi:sugar phosphate isomerase/epimerase